MTTTTKVNQLADIGTIANGDKLVGERVDGTTVRITYAASGAVDSVNTQTGAVVLDADDISDTTTTHKFTTASDISKLAAITGTNTGDQTISLTGDVTGSGTGSFAATISNSAVTYAKIQDVSATDKLLGRSTALSGPVEEIACTAAGRALIDDADAAAQRTTLGLGTLATQSGTFSGTSSGTNTGDQTITLTGGVTGSGTGSFAATVVTNANLTGDVTSVGNATTIVTPSSATVATDDKILIKDTSASDVMKYVTAQSVRDLAPGSGTLTSAQLATALTDETGSGAAVFATSPTLVSPTLGAASATSINFGGGALSSFVPSTSFTPTITFLTPGDLSVSYTTQSAKYIRIGDNIYISLLLQFTPTFTTASGNFIIGSLPYATNGSTASWLTVGYIGSAFKYPTNATFITSQTVTGSAQLNLLGNGSGISGTAFTTAHLTSGSIHLIRLTGYYFL